MKTRIFWNSGKLQTITTYWLYVIFVFKNVFYSILLRRQSYLLLVLLDNRPKTSTLTVFEAAEVSTYSEKIVGSLLKKKRKINTHESQSIRAEIPLPRCWINLETLQTYVGRLTRSSLLRSTSTLPSLILLFSPLNGNRCPDLLSLTKFFSFLYFCRSQFPGFLGTSRLSEGVAVMGPFRESTCQMIQLLERIALKFSWRSNSYGESDSRWMDIEVQIPHFDN